MKKDFKLGGANGASALTEEMDTILAESEFNLKFIKIDDIETNKLNEDFQQIDIEALSRSIEDIGLQHNLVVLKEPSGKYRLISGERRFRAIKLLLERDPKNKSFKNGIPCKVVSDISEVEEEIRLIRSNTDTRPLTAAERRKAILRLIELYKVRKSKGEISSTYSQLSEDLQISVRQIQKYAATENLIPELEKLLEKGSITINESEQFSRLDEDGQKLVAELYDKQGSVEKQDLDEIKKLQDEKALIKAELTKKIDSLVKERDQLHEKIQEQERTVNAMSESMEHPGGDIEAIILEKAAAENKAEALRRQKEQLQYKYNELKEEMKKPIKIDDKRLKEIKAEVTLESALTKMENEFDSIKSKQGILKSDEDLRHRYEILCNRMTSLLK